MNKQKETLRHFFVAANIGTNITMIKCDKVDQEISSASLQANVKTDTGP